MAETQKLDLASDRPMRILVVHPQVGSEVGRLLARDGHDVLELGGEDWPRRMLGVFVPDLILTLCPEPARVCRELREAAPEVAILALVSGREVADRVTVLDAGADDCLAMPYHDAELRARLWVVCRHRAPRARQPRRHPTTLGGHR
jgi:DNA-binding response OmpR family regulator